MDPLNDDKICLSGVFCLHTEFKQILRYRAELVVNTAFLYWSGDTWNRFQHNCCFSGDISGEYIDIRYTLLYTIELYFCFLIKQTIWSVWLSGSSQSQHLGNYNLYAPFSYKMYLTEFLNVFLIFRVRKWSSHRHSVKTKFETTKIREFHIIITIKSENTNKWKLTCIIRPKTNIWNERRYHWEHEESEVKLNVTKWMVLTVRARWAV